MKNISTEKPTTIIPTIIIPQTIDDFFPFTEETELHLKNDLGKTPNEIICPYMQAIHLKKELSSYSIYGTCKCDLQECRYNPKNYSPKQCQTKQEFRTPNPATDIRYAIFCVGK